METIKQVIAWFWRKVSRRHAAQQPDPSLEVVSPDTPMPRPEWLEQSKDNNHDA